MVVEERFKERSYICKLDRYSSVKIVEYIGDFKMNLELKMQT